MSEISPSVLDSISHLLPAPESINFLCLAEYWGRQWYMAFGQRCFYFIDTDLSAYKTPPIPYSKIKVCCVCEKKKPLM